MVKRPLSLLTLASLILGLLGLAASVRAQDYPKGPITLIIPLAPGDAADVAGRAMGDELSRLLNVPIVVNNKPGAGAALGTDQVVKAQKDGYTIVLTINGALTFRRVLDPETATYDPEKDLAPLGLATRTPIILAVRSDVPFKNFAEMAAYGKKNPGAIRVGTAGKGSIGDFAIEIINSLTGAGLVNVPFKGASPAVTALRGGHIEGVALALGAVSGHLKSGAMKGIAISNKFPDFPDVPTLPELGYKQNILGVSLMFFAPAGVPAEVTNALVPAIEKVVKNPAIAARLLTLGMAQDYVPPGKVFEEVREERRTIEEIAKRVGLVK